MPLEEYDRKRKFDKTPEPPGQTAKRKGQLRFVVQRHQAQQLHYDFRLELDGVLKSWSVPKGPSLTPGERRLAVMVEDHPLDYRDFEGIIPEHNYGAGTVMVWDQGTYRVRDPKVKPDDEEGHLKEGLEKGHITFILEGQKLKGEFALVKLKNSDKDNMWLLLKKGDEFASDQDVLEHDKSVLTKRSMDQIAKSEVQWTRAGKLDLEVAPKRAQPIFVKPMLATLVEQPFDKPDWLFEVKWDGYRIQARCDDPKVKLLSRKQQDYSEIFGPITAELKKAGLKATLDGEMVAVDRQGRSQFQLLQSYQQTGQGALAYYVFDLLWLDGHDLTQQSLRQRKEWLRQILPVGGYIKFSDHIESEGRKFFDLAIKQDLEGIVAKSAGSDYKPGVRSRNWLKIKTHRRQEVVIGGFTQPRGSRSHFGALVVGVYDGRRLLYAGHVGGGFDEAKLTELEAKLKPLVQTESPFAEVPKTNTPAKWVKPELVAEVVFREWTEEGQMRQPIFVGLREDKPAREVKREVAKPAAVIQAAPTSSEETLTIESHKVKVTNLTKVYWPDDGYTKGDLINYYRSVAEVILPHLKDRPESLNRFPNGITGESFYQKNLDYQPPNWAKTIRIKSDSESREVNYLVCQNQATLVYMANLGCIEIHPWNSRMRTQDKPDFAVIDLDPEDISFEEVIKTARAVHRILDRAGAASYPKTSGATGLHIYIPLAAKYSYDQTKQFAELIANLTNQQLPDITSVVRMPAKRQKRVYLDFLQNRRGQTLASAYSVRPRPGATVSTPLQWSEVKKGLDPTKFTIQNTRKRIDKVGDLWQPVLGEGIDLAACLKRLAG